MDLVVDLCVWLFVLLGFATLVESFVALCVSRVSREVGVTAAARASAADADEDGDDDGNDGDDDDNDGSDDDDGGSTSSNSNSSDIDDDNDNDNDDGHARRRRAVEWTHDSLFSFYESLATRNVPLTQKQKQRARLEGLLDDLNGETHWWRVIRSCDGGDGNGVGDGDGAKDGGGGEGDVSAAAAAHLTSLSPRTRRRVYDWGVLSMETLARLIVLDVFLLEHEPSLLAKERYLNDVFMPSLFKFKNVFVLHGHVQQLRRRRRPLPPS